MVQVPEGGELELDVQLEDVGDGVLVTALVTAPLVGECARCLDEFCSSTQVRFRELFAAVAGGSGDDGYLWTGICSTSSLRCGTRWSLSCRCPRCAVPIAQDCAAGAALSSLTRSPGTLIPTMAASGRY